MIVAADCPDCDEPVMLGANATYVSHYVTEDSETHRVGVTCPGCGLKLAVFVDGRTARTIAGLLRLLAEVRRVRDRSELHVRFDRIVAEMRDV